MSERIHLAAMNNTIHKPPTTQENNFMCHDGVRTWTPKAKRVPAAYCRLAFRPPKASHKTSM
jgi:hypothetical protein